MVENLRALDSLKPYLNAGKAGGPSKADLLGASEKVMAENLKALDSLKPNLYTGEASGPSKVESPGVAEKTEKAEKAEEREERRDEYIPDDEENKKSAGLYHMEVDENGRPKIVSDDSAKPAKSDTPAEPPVNAVAEQEAEADERKAEQAEDEKSKGNENPEKPEKKKAESGGAIADDSAWQAEIAQITNKKAQLAQQMSSVGDDEEKRKALEAKIAQVESELAAKNTDAYRKQRGTTTLLP